MMRKLYLTTTIPAKGSGLEAYKSDNWPEDIQQKILSHESDRKQMTNIPPSIKMLPLAKYQTSKWSKTLQSMPKAPLTEQDKKESWIQGAIQRLPLYAQSRAKRLTPYLIKIHDSEDGFYELLHDLTTTNLRVKSEYETLRKVLESFSEEDVPDDLYVDKLTPIRGRSQSKKPGARGRAPTRRPKKPTQKWV